MCIAPPEPQTDQRPAGTTGTGPARTPPAHREPRKVPLTEEVILERLERVQRAAGFPPEVMGLLLEALCPDALEEPPLPAGPTRHLPGTAGRLAVMAERAERGEALFHPDDAQWEESGTLHLEQVGKLSRNGKADRLGCPVRDRRGGEVVDIGTDPEKAAEAIRRHFKGEALAHLAGLLWEALGWASRRESPARQPAPPPGPAPGPDGESPARRRDLERLRRAAPNLAALVQRRELALGTALVLAGLRDRRVAVPLVARKAARTLRRHFQGEALAGLIAQLAREPGPEEATAPALAGAVGA